MGVRKPDGQRIRRNKPVRVELGEPDVVPALPEWVDAGPHVVHEWNTLWAHPISTMWETVDHAAIARLCVLRGEVAAGVLDDRQTLTAIQSLEDRFYLNPRARRLAGIVLPDADAKVELTDVDRSDLASATVPRRRDLKVVNE